MYKTKITVCQLFNESYDKKEYKSNKSYQNGIYPDEVQVFTFLRLVESCMEY
jgi:hypothetical protein